MLAHRMIWVMFGRRLDGSPHVARPRIDLLFLEPNPRQRFVVVVPARVGFFFAPWWTRSDDHARRKLIESEHAVPLRCVGQDQDQIGQDRLNFTCLVKNEVVSPITFSFSGVTTQFRFARAFQVVEAILENQL